MRERKLTEVRFCVSERWLYSAHVGLDRSQLNCCASLHFRLWERPPIVLREHLLPDKDSGNTRPVAIAVPDDMYLGKLGPILWLSFLHLYHIYQKKSDMALAHGWCPALVWLHTFLYMSFSFSTEDIAGMSCEVGVLFLRLSLNDLKSYISLHASESNLSHQRNVVGLVWGHLQLTSKLPPDVIAFKHQNLPPLLSYCPVCLRIILCALWQFLGWNRQLVVRLVKQQVSINPLPDQHLQSHHPYVQDQPHRHPFLGLGK